ncbi:GTPase Era [Zhaonella formicivorans]|uniref:GTPase Era n=1 Tax=Zhaonella formicivorans TaxID=2528593 RepID=UPI0010EDC66C|nr:GTPase Era [Zhaonella formicivorans]
MTENFRSGFVAIIGRPNVGKSTLLNRVLGQKVAIMSDKPQTTRNKIRGVYTAENVQIVFLDTPGIHKPKHKLGEYMVETALHTLREVDAVLYVVDVTAEYGAGEEYVLKALSQVDTPVILALNKIDLLDKNKLLALIAEYSHRFDFAAIVPVSAASGENVERLLQVLAQYLPEGPQYYPPEMVTDQPERLVIAELIREKVLHLTREEVPHSVAVQIETIEQRGTGGIYVGAVIYVERDSQKGIIIGKKGQMLKSIGQLAREDIEALLGSKTYLELWVKVRPDWRRREADLRNFGYTPQE